MGETPHAVLFDWEGTLVDFQWNLAGAVTQAREELVALGLPPASVDSHYAVLRNKATAGATAHGLDAERVRRCVDQVYDGFDQDALSRWSLRPHAADALGYLAERGVATGLVTNIGRRAIDAALLRFNLTAAFRVVVTRNDVSMLKPDTEGILAALAGLEVSARSALFVGDSTADVRASKLARVPVAIVTGGENAADIIASEEPTFIWDSLYDLRALFTAGE